MVKTPDWWSTWSWFKTHLCHSVVFLGKTLYSTFPCLVVLASNICTKLLADSNILASLEAGCGNCLPYVYRLHCFPVSQEDKYKDKKKRKLGFNTGSQSVEEVILLMQNIECSCKARKEATAVFVDLTAIYWYALSATVAVPASAVFVGLTAIYWYALSGTVALPASCWGFCQINTTLNIYAACSKLKFHPYYQWQQAKQPTLSEKLYSLGIDLVSTPFEHLYIQFALYIFRKFAESDDTTTALFWKLEGPSGEFKSRHVYIFIISPDLKVEAQSD